MFAPGPTSVPGVLEPSEAIDLNIVIRGGGLGSVTVCWLFTYENMVSKIYGGAVNKLTLKSSRMDRHRNITRPNFLSRFNFYPPSI